MSTSPIFDSLLAAEQGRDEGMAQTENAADPRIMATIDAHIAEANASGRRWSANDIRDLLPVSSRGLVGARVRAAAARRPVEMVAVGREPSNLPSTHLAEIKIWVGAEHVQAVAS